MLLQLWLVTVLLSVAVAQRVTMVAMQNDENLYLMMNVTKMELNDVTALSTSIAFQLAPLYGNSSINSEVDSVIVTMSVYSEWTAQLEGEQQIKVPLAVCMNTSLCGVVPITLRPVRLGGASVLLVLRFVSSEASNCAMDKQVQLPVNGTWQKLCTSGVARRLVPVAVVHERDLYDKIFRYTTLTCVVLLTFLMGTQLNIDEVLRILRRPLAPCLGIACQYVGMPLLAVALCQLFFMLPSPYASQPPSAALNVTIDPPPSGDVAVSLNQASETLRSAMLAFGLLALGSAPGGGASNTWTVLLRGDLQLSMSLTFFSTVLSFGMMPFWLFLLTPLILRHLPLESVDTLLQGDDSVNSSAVLLHLGTNVSTQYDAGGLKDASSVEQQLKVPYIHIVYQLLAFVGPCVLGVLIRKFLQRFAEKLRIPLKCVSGFFVLFMVTYGVWVHRYVFRVLADDPRLFGLTGALPYLGYSLGYAVAYGVLRKRPQSIAVAVETGIQNMSIAVLFIKYNLPSPASDLGTVPLILVSLIGPLPLYFIFMVLLIRKHCYQRRNLREDAKSAHDALCIELQNAKLTDEQICQLEKDGLLNASNTDDSNGKLIESSISTSTTEDTAS